MKYQVGMFGGSFDPLHVGHIHDIIRAAALCEELYIVISWCEGRESTSKELRYRWILNSCRRLSNIRRLLVEDKELLEVYGIKYDCICGDYLSRFDAAKRLIECKIGFSTKWLMHKSHEVK